VKASAFQTTGRTFTVNAKSDHGTQLSYYAMIKRGRSLMDPFTPVSSSDDRFSEKIKLPFLSRNPVFRN